MLGVFGKRFSVVSSKFVFACRYAGTVGTTVNLLDKGVNINWAAAEDDGKKFKGNFYHSIWLRHNCHCQNCYNLHSDQHVVEADELPNARVTRAEVHGQLSASAHDSTSNIDVYLVSLFYSSSYFDGG